MKKIHVKIPFPIVWWISWDRVVVGLLDKCTWRFHTLEGTPSVRRAQRNGLWNRRWMKKSQICGALQSAIARFSACSSENEKRCRMVAFKFANTFLRIAKIFSTFFLACGRGWVVGCRWQQVAGWGGRRPIREIKILNCKIVRISFFFVNFKNKNLKFWNLKFY